MILPHVVVTGFDDAGRVPYEHINWEQATLLVQVGFRDPSLLLVSAAEQAARLRDRHEPANTFILRWAQTTEAQSQSCCGFRVAKFLTAMQQERCKLTTLCENHRPRGKLQPIRS